jgi:hypothetical protein
MQEILLGRVHNGRYRQGEQRCYCEQLAYVVSHDSCAHQSEYFSVDTNRMLFALVGHSVDSLVQIYGQDATFQIFVTVVPTSGAYISPLQQPALRVLLYSMRDLWASSHLGMSNSKRRKESVQLMLGLAHLKDIAWKREI